MDLSQAVRGPFVLLPDGRIDCEFRHPTAGEDATPMWVPFTASAEDREAVGRLIHAYCLTQI